MLRGRVGVRPSVPRTALRYYNLRLFVGGQALSNVGTFSQVVALSLLVLSLTDSGVALRGVMAMQAVPIILLGPWASTRAGESTCRSRWHTGWSSTRCRRAPPSDWAPRAPSSLDWCCSSVERVVLETST